MQQILYTTAGIYKTRMCLIFKAYVCDKIRLEGSYSRVHISSDKAFFKILEKPSIVQK